MSIENGVLQTCRGTKKVCSKREHVEIIKGALSLPLKSWPLLPIGRGNTEMLAVLVAPASRIRIPKWR